MNTIIFYSEILYIKIVKKYIYIFIYKKKKKMKRKIKENA